MVCLCDTFSYCSFALSLFLRVCAYFLCWVKQTFQNRIFIFLWSHLLSTRVWFHKPKLNAIGFFRIFVFVFESNTLRTYRINSLNRRQNLLHSFVHQQDYKRGNFMDRNNFSDRFNWDSQLLLTLSASASNEWYFVVFAIKTKQIGIAVLFSISICKFNSHLIKCL